MTEKIMIRFYSRKKKIALALLLAVLMVLITASMSDLVRPLWATEACAQGVSEAALFEAETAVPACWLVN